MLNTSHGIITDPELTLNLPVGVYEISGSIIYYSGTNNDMELFLDGNGDISASFNAIAQYGIFTNHGTAVPYYNQQINSTTGEVLGGGGTGDANKSGVSITGYITIRNNNAQLKLKYNQQAGISTLARDTKVFKNTYIKATKIQ